MSKSRIFVFFAFLQFFCLPALFAQTTSGNYFVPTIFRKAPNSAAFTKYGDYPVNLFTGLPDISIPLYNIQSGGLSVPITLSYHASGIRVSDVASWVGLGWSLSTGGSITRKVMGSADEETGGFLQGHLRVDAAINAEIDSDVTFLDNVVKGQYDTQPDIFSYDFPGHNGKFFFDATNSFKPALIPFAPISIRNTNFNPSHYTDPYVPHFAVKDEHGNSYLFGYNNIERTRTETPSHTGFSNTAFMLEQMLTQDKKDTVSFSYASQDVTYPDEQSMADIITSNVDNHGDFTRYVSQYTPNNNSYNISTVSEKLIQQIKFTNGKVVFELDATRRNDIGNSSYPNYGLNKIRVYSINHATNTYTLQKSVVFYKSYFYPGVTNQQRLRLDSIQVLDAGGSIMQHYRFVYNSSVTMPLYGSFAKDYWGFYNGKANTSMIPNQTVTYVANVVNGQTTTQTIGSTVPNSRFSDSTYMQACVLQTVYYPTGGHTDFTFETNRYLDEQGIMQLAGGLRVSSIKSYDGVNPAPIVKTYKYNLNTARKNFQLGYDYFAMTQTHHYWETIRVSLVNTSIETMTSYVSNSKLDLYPFDASLVVYPNVSEYIGTPGSNIGRTDYIFRDQPDGYQEASAAGIPIPATRFYARGQLLSKTEYLSKPDGSYQKVKKDSSSYTAFPQNLHVNVGLAVGQLIVNEGTVGPTFMPSSGQFSPGNYNLNNGFVFHNYGLVSDDNYLTGTTSYIYDQTDPSKFSASTVTNKYDNIIHQQVSRVYQTDSKGNTSIATMKYPADYQSGNAVLDTMLNRNMQAEMIEKWDTVKNVTTGINGVIAGQVNFFQFESNSSVLPARISKLRVSAPLTNFVRSSVASGTGAFQSDSRYVQMISFDQYDYKNNLTQYTPRNGAPVSVVWGYDYTQPSAEIKNAVLGTVAYTSFESKDQGNWSYSGSPVMDPTAPTGQSVYPLTNGTVTTYPQDYTRNYVLSYWSNNGAATVYAGNYIGGTALRTANGWTYFEYQIPAGFSSSVSVSGTTSIDELAFYPKDAQITTYSYDANGLTGLTDTKGVVTGFEYDFFQRLKNIRDWNGNIVKNYGYHNYDMTIGNDAISTPVLTRNNYPPGTNPTSTTFTVPASKYLSSTKASANAEAQFDHDTYGQIYANKTCGCPVQMISFTLTNNSGATGLSANFSGPGSYSFPFPATGSTIVQIPAGTYSLSLPPVSPFNSHHWKLGNVRAEIYAPSASFSSVVIGTGSTDSFVMVY
ncbi:DUF5977 domain-containing protein [Mucilaginibacter sp.]|uniref:DUF5977 domain-containing protein n=1 Tax=Mucilaginibacter sp. TaxID=1882438 RepID=UPI0025F91457|nr:DUF5977 domain-containing protein [Mucilaginibacter sp.]